MSSLYGAVVAEHSRSPRNQGSLPAPDAAHEATNPLCGDRLRMELRIERGRIAAARFRGEACMIAVAAASLLTGMLEGLPLADAAALPEEKVIAALQTPLRPSRVGCATLCLQAMRAALAQAPP
jgi:nitrogen fixation NifU-like protein